MLSPLSCLALAPFFLLTYIELLPLCYYMETGGQACGPDLIAIPLLYVLVIWEAISLVI